MATWNPSDKGSNISLSGGNLSAAGATAYNSVRATLAHSTGKWYWENKITANSGNTQQGGFGTAAMLLTNYVGSTSKSCGAGPDGTTYVTGITNTPSLGVSWTVNDVMNFAVDLDAGKIWCGKNGTWVASGNPGTGANPWCTFTPPLTLFPAYSANNSSNSETANFGATAFANTVPSGFLGWGAYALASSAASFAFTPATINLTAARHLLAGAIPAFAYTPAAIAMHKGKVLAAGAVAYSLSLAAIVLAHFVSPASKLALRVTKFALQKLRGSDPALQKSRITAPILGD
jgi:hypothetical protein